MRRFYASYLASNASEASATLYCGNTDLFFTSPCTNPNGGLRSSRRWRRIPRDAGRSTHTRVRILHEIECDVRIRRGRALKKCNTSPMGVRNSLSLSQRAHKTQRKHVSRGLISTAATARDHQQSAPASPLLQGEPDRQLHSAVILPSKVFPSWNTSLAINAARTAACSAEANWCQLEA